MGATATEAAPAATKTAPAVTMAGFSGGLTIDRFRFRPKKGHQATGLLFWGLNLNRSNFFRPPPPLRPRPRPPRQARPHPRPPRPLRFAFFCGLNLGKKNSVCFFGSRFRPPEKSKKYKKQKKEIFFRV